ncbi:MAG TPA: SAM-dependent methyltransferase [Mycobacterium sp.]|nr:SAM-dependent methyltransferase [Mycobacterium sp.]
MADAALPRPAPIEAGGTLKGSSRVQPASLPAVELLERAARAVELPHAPNTIVIADYGASAGHNSLLPIRTAISVIRSRAESGRAICVFHADVAENNYAALYEALDSDPQSYLHDDPATFASSSGRSVYQQVVPTNIVTLGWSSWAVHWLSRVPATIHDHVHIACSSDAEAKAAFARQAADDWISFLSARSRELVPGGRLVVLTMGADDSEPGYQPLLDALRDELAAMIGEGVVTRDEVTRMAIPSVGRTEAQLTAPFAPTNRFAGLLVEDMEMFDAEDQYWTRFEKDGDAAVFAKNWTAFARASVFPTLIAFLDEDAERRQRFVERLETGLRDRLTADPKRVRIPLAKVLLDKRSWPR